MELHSEMAGDVLIVKLSGRLDAESAPYAQGYLADVFSQNLLGLALDMAELEYISSAGLRILLIVARKGQQSRCKVVLFGMVPHVREVFTMSGFEKIFAIELDRAAALAALG